MDAVAERYAWEIRSWLLGRIQKKRQQGEVAQSPHRFTPNRALFWWIFEGKRYPWLEGPLCFAWSIVERHARRLLETHNPSWRRVDLPEGETDWLASLTASATSARRVFVSRASHVGLNVPEQSALLGWLHWIKVNWDDYVRAVGAPDGSSESLSWVADLPAASEVNIQAIRRWAHIARRSRWPLMRNVVAESLRCTFEEQLVDHLPLPSDHATLFELLCMVRVLRTLEPTPDHIRWLNLDAGQNNVVVGGMTFSYQHSLPKEEIMATQEFGHGLKEAVERHGVRVPLCADGWLAFEKPRGRLGGILLEAKSGTQSYDAAVHQLKCYRAALKLRFPYTILVWGIAEQAGDQSQGSALRALRAETLRGEERDIWVFSNADQIPAVLEAVAISYEGAAGSQAA